MSPLRRRLLGVLAATAIAVTAAAPATAAPGEWQSSPLFTIEMWDVPSLYPTATMATYQLLDAEGRAVGAKLERPMTDPLGLVDVPAIPGAYILEGWLEDAAGNELERESTLLRFDDAVPPPPRPSAPGRWLLGSEAAVLEIEPPAPPLPLSGIDGYEVALDRGGHFETSAASISLGYLPEGINYARVTARSGAGVLSEDRVVAFKVDASPPTVSLAGLPSGWSGEPVKVAALAQDHLSGVEPSGPTGPFTAIEVDGSAPITAPGGSVSAWIAGSGIHSVRFYARDGAGNVADGGPGSAPPGTALVRIDEEAPRVAFAAAQDPAEPERIEAFVGDSLSGPSPVRGSIAVRPSGTRARFEALPTRVERGRLIAHWDSDAYPAGKYEFLATGFDVAGNAAQGANRQRGGQMVLVNPLKAPVSLRTVLTGTRLSGTLRRIGGGGVPGQPIAVTETFARGADPSQRTTYVRTRDDGAFSLRLKPGPTREVVASFGGNRLLTRATGPGAHLGTATVIRFRTSAKTATIGGRPIVFSGRVGTTGAGQAARGLPVELQFRYPGAGWSGFRTVEADGHGRFRYAYRFNDNDSRGVRFQFRAHVKGREGWPYEPSASRPLSVRGR